MHNTLMGALHPAGSLYERPVNMAACTRQHAAFRAALRAHGVRCLTVREILLYDTDACVRARVALEDLAASRLRYELDTACDARLLSAADRFFVGEEYKRQVLETMSAEQLVDVVLCAPTVHVMPSFRDTGFTARYAFEPLTNLQFTRDQAVTTCRGVVLARLRSPQRQREVELLGFCFDKLGLPVVGAIAAPGFLEGGDFFAAGRRLALIGVGLRSNVEACAQLMEGDMLGTSRVALVRDDFERDQARMHLDCLFNIVADDVCLLAEDVMGDGAPLRRTVDEYERVEAEEDSEEAGDGDGHAGEHGAAPQGAAAGGAGARRGRSTPRYVLRRSGVEFSAYLREAGFHIVPVSRAHSLQYGCNVLNLGDSDVLCCHAETARQLVRCAAFHGRVRHIEFGDVTSMYGALHCSSQVVRRAPTGAGGGVGGGACASSLRDSGGGV
jgi:arginine deiminase